MACYSPIRGYRGPGGSVSLSPKGSYIDRTFEVKCGQCIGCRLEHSRQWAVRIMHEAQQHEENSFLTLTYDDEHLPPHGSLRVRDWQLFAKRLRKQLGPFRFYHCGEYGDSTNRPHLHVCLFGLDFHLDRREHTRNQQGDPLYTSETLESIWGNGITVIGDLTFQSAAYVARYVTKKVTGKHAEEHYEIEDPDHYGALIDLKPEYATMSRRPGIGKTWLNEYQSQVYPRDEVIVRGHQAQPPRYYDDQVEQSDPEMIKSIKARRRRKQAERQADETPERRIVREVVRTAKTNLFSRNPKD